MNSTCRPFAVDEYTFWLCQKMRGLVRIKKTKNYYLARFVQKFTSCNILARITVFCKNLASHYISCKILPGNTFLTRSSQAIHFLQGSARQYTYKSVPGNIFLAISCQSIHFLQETYKNFARNLLFGRILQEI